MPGRASGGKPKPKAQVLSGSVHENWCQGPCWWPIVRLRKLSQSSQWLFPKCPRQPTARHAKLRPQCAESQLIQDCIAPRSASVPQLCLCHLLQPGSGAAAGQAGVQEPMEGLGKGGAALRSCLALQEVTSLRQAVGCSVLSPGCRLAWILMGFLHPRWEVTQAK